VEEMTALLTGLIATILGAGLILSALCGAWLLGRQSRMRKDFSRQNESELLQRSDTRLDELTRTLDALVHEVERVAEAHRYTARLLTDRAAPDLARPLDDPMRAPERIVTPH
jgi:hypothetical protein